MKEDLVFIRLKTEIIDHRQAVFFLHALLELISKCRQLKTGLLSDIKVKS